MPFVIHSLHTSSVVSRLGVNLAGTKAKRLQRSCVPAQQDPETTEAASVFTGRLLIWLNLPDKSRPRYIPGSCETNAKCAQPGFESLSRSQLVASLVAMRIMTS